ncbi:hypothetical protein C2G38_2217866 [Gigaspora rosea]|uniref:Uncharacterized protein n=1 Tax=Gigaspora rosea TaxID=44941 RepID=A0A397UFS7_9GLOM|nr:hypothetical protein C2G38_2217866 [Gigaspora rosea]
MFIKRPSDNTGLWSHSNTFYKVRYKDSHSGPCCVDLCLVSFDPIFLPMVLAWFRFVGVVLLT